ncbi:MAG: hypothetical protein WC756_19270 [Taibaiella sp.]|jgi:hypothetical protein
MKSIFKFLLIGLLWLNGIVSIVSGIRILYHMHYPTWLNNFLLPGVVLFILLGVGSILLTFFTKKHPLILASGALIEGLCLVFMLTGQQEIFHRLDMMSLLLGVEGLTLIITAAILMATGTTTIFKRQ